ncbi:type II toxin-antitoxin system death-on-curing family toxin [candidate division KSB1 bacterium]|nr:type II toxin-antitoxin system death-on-curing family toxin [bacterium]NUM65555.1 type II toxin-antitoxin system death-on-curing family toxin [candidate division KSB1 bacterium]
MMKFINIFQVLELHRQLLDEFGGIAGVRDFGALESALAQPEMTFGGEDLYPTLIEKASALAYSLCKNHPFIDGNKRVAHGAMEIFLVLNGFEIKATIDEQENLFLDLAGSRLTREGLVNWLRQRVVPLS